MRIIEKKLTRAPFKGRLIVRSFYPKQAKSLPRCLAFSISTRPKVVGDAAISSIHPTPQTSGRRLSEYEKALNYRTVALLTPPHPARPLIVSQPPRRRFPNEPHDPHDSLVRSRLQQRQQQDTGTPRQQQYSAFSSSSTSLPRSLRRTPHFEEQQLPRSRSASVDSASRRQPNVRFAESPERPGRRRAASIADAPGGLPATHPALRISPRTASAILYALEVGLRSPNPFTPDLIEENASMSDLAGDSRAQNGGPRSAPGRGQTSGQAFKTPTEIMKNRRAREAAREARERGQPDVPEEEDRGTPQDQDRRRAAERRYAATGVAAHPPRDSGYQSQGPSVGGRTPAGPPYTPGRASAIAGRGEETLAAPFATPNPAQSSYPPSTQPVGRPRGAGNLEESSDHPQAVSQPSSRTQQAQTQPRAEAVVPTSQSTRGASASHQAATSGGSDGAQRRSSNVSSFPHAFERWETLSSRWEGLTSYWIGRLEQNTKEIRRDPERQQMSRQITDLSAAGANLFHAVVELQRLRASSERKFQRWFFEVRDQQEQAQQAQANLQRMLEDERQARAEDSRSSQQMRNSDRLLQEYRRELQISKDEARRAWEELGRREQAERERILSLREGHPIEIGGVQVLPTNAPSRGGSLQRAGGQDPAYQSQATPSRGTVPGEQEYEYSQQQEHSPTDTDPFSGRERAVPTFQGGQAGPAYGQIPLRTSSAQATTSARPPASAATASQRTREQVQDDSPSARFYSQPNTFVQAPGTTAAPGPTITQTRGPAEPMFSGSDSDDEPGYELDENGEVRFDTDGNPIRYRGLPRGSSLRAPAAGGAGEEIETGNLRPHRSGQSVSTEQAPAVMQGHSGTIEYEPADYEGSGYGSADTGWEGIATTQRHHHPTRLSDVLEEEDERSRTSGRASRGSGGMF